MNILILILCCVFSSLAHADFNTGDTFGKGLIIQNGGATLTGGGRTLNFSSGVTVSGGVYNIPTGGGGSGSGNVGIGTVNDIAYYTGTTTVNGNNNFVQNGVNVGIGTIIPRAKLEVGGTLRANQYLYAGGGKMADVDTYYPSPGNPIFQDNTGFIFYPVGGIKTLVSSAGEIHWNDASNTTLTDVDGNLKYSEGFGTLADGFGNLYAQNNFYIGGTRIGDEFGSLYYSGGSQLTDNLSNLYVTVGGIFDFTSSLGSSGQCLQTTGSEVIWSTCGGTTTYTSGSPITDGSGLLFDGGGGTGPNITDGAGNYYYYNGAGASGVAISGEGQFEYSNIGVNLTGDVGDLYLGGGAQLGDGSNNVYVTNGQLIDSTISGGVSGYFLGSTGSGVQWSSPVAGPSRSLQFNDGGIFGGTANFVTDGTNVGIGTSDLTQDALTVNGGVASGGFYLQFDGSAGIIPSSATNTDIDFFTNGIRRMAVTHAGNIGIGTTLPIQLLDVKGTARMTGFILSTSPSNGYVLTSDATGIGTWKAATGGSGTVTTVSVASANGFAGIVATATTTPAITLTTTVTSNVLKGNGTAIVAATAGTDYLAPTGSGAALTGIPLTVSNSDGTLTVSPTTGSVVASLALSHANTWTGQQIFNTSNVGVGSATPGQALDVNGTVRAANFSGAGTSLTGTASSLNIGGNAATATTAATVTTAAQPTITSVGTLTSLLVSGNVGINSTTPGQKLDVVGTVRMTGFNIASGASNGYILTSDASGNGTWKIAAAANVGIGTTNDVTFWNTSSTLGANNKLTFDGTAFGASQSVFTSTSSGTPGVDAEGASGGTALYANVNGVGSIALHLSGGGKNISETTTAQNDFAGAVGIGTTVYGNALAINGSYTQQWGTKIPSISSCGGGTPAVKGTDNDFQITVGTVATGCTASFGGTYADASCVVTNQSMSVTSALGYTVSSSAIVISQGVGLSGDLLNVHCGFKN